MRVFTVFYSMVSAGGTGNVIFPQFYFIGHMKAVVDAEQEQERIPFLSINSVPYADF